MDSMRSLNSSLPSSRPNRPAPPEQLLQAFRTAALSVTNLYKSAATEQAHARQAGYQDALADLLKFLDKENLGLQDGEGWRVRQWATARYDGGAIHSDETEGEEEQYETAARPVTVSHQEEEDPAAGQEQSEHISDTPRPDSEEDSDSANRPDVFRFSASAQPDNSMQTDQPISPQPIENDRSSSSSSAPIRVEVLSRNGRPASRPHNTRLNTRTNPREFTFTSGSKRKIQFPDFFDISNLNEKRDGFGGGGSSKKGRFV